MDPDEQVEYVVAVNNADTKQTATFDTYQPARSMLKAVWPASAPRNLKTDTEGRVTVTVPPLSAVVYKATSKLRADRDAADAVVHRPRRRRHRHRPRRGGRHRARVATSPR